MAISVSIPKEITEYEEKIMFGMSLRKLICFFTAVVLGVGTYFLCTKILKLSMDAASYIIIVEAMPLMAFGFIKKDGMTFEKYIALLSRHRLGVNRLYYGTDLLIDELPKTSEERKSKYAWIFEKENGSTGTKQSRAERRKEKHIREAIIFEVTKKERKRKCKEARRAIKAARQEYRTLKQRKEKADKKARST